MTGMSDLGWQRQDAGAHVSLAVPIEMNMRHGTPPILKTLRRASSLLSVDVECTLTADMFTQMRSAMALQRMFMNARALGEPYAAGFRTWSCSPRATCCASPPRRAQTT